MSANRIKALRWVADGVVGFPERQASEALIAAALWHPAVFDTLMGMRWVQGDITVHEAYTIYRTRWIAYYAPDLAGSVLEKPWTQDGITRDEAEVIDRLYGLIPDEDTPRHQEVIRKAVEILAMPFLNTVESADALAIRSLYQERYRGDRSTELLRLLAHPALVKITDDEAKIVLLVAGTNQHQPESVIPLLDTLVSDEGVYIEEHTVNLSYSCEVTLAIIRHVDQVIPSVSMERFEFAVATIDDFMGWPLHTNHVTWYFGQMNGGIHYGTHIASNPEYDDENYDGGPSHIAHESGHLYWTSRGTHWIDKSTPSWMKEGAADFLAIVVENARVGRPLVANREPCLLDNIRDLEVSESDESGCEYSLGQRLFLDLYHSLGEETFREGFRNLYLKRLRNAPDDGCDDNELGICHVRHAFRSVAPPEAVETVDNVISRWYEGTEPYDLSRLDHRPVDPNMLSIDGQVADAFISLDPRSREDPKSRTNRVSLAQLKELGGRVYVHWLVTFPPATQNMNVPMTTAQYYEDGFIFERSSDFQRNKDVLDVRVGRTYDWETAGVGSSDPDRWAIGQYGVYIYDENRKVAQVEFEVVP